MRFHLARTRMPKTLEVHTRLRFSFVIGTGFLSACSLINPYQLSESLSADLKLATPEVSAFNVLCDSNVMKDCASKGLMQWGGGLQAALAAVDDQRKLWAKTAAHRASADALASYATLGAAAYGAYRGLLVGSSSDSAKRALSQASVLAGGRYAVKQWVEEPGRDAAYLKGYRALTCTMLAGRPVAMDSDVLGTVQENGNPNSLHGQLLTLEEEIFNLNQQIQTASSNPLRTSDPVNEAQKEARSALKLAKAKLERGEWLARQMIPLAYPAPSS
jgi:hypothetical protein